MMTRHKSVFFAIVALSLAVSMQAATSSGVCTAKNTVRADIVALDNAYFVNRLGSFQSGGQIFALRRDVVSTGPSSDLTPGHVMLRASKRPRPIVLRMNVGDCLEIKFQNLLGEYPQVYFQYPPVVPWAGASQMTNADPSSTTNPVSQYGNNDSGTFANSVIQTPTRWAGVHVMGLEVVGAFDQNGAAVDAISGDGSFAGRNDITANIATDKRASGLVPPGARMTYLLHAPSQTEGSYLLYSTAANVGYEPSYSGQLMQGLFGSVTVQPKYAEYYRSEVTRQNLWDATYPSAGQNLKPTGKSVTIRGQKTPVWAWTTEQYVWPKGYTEPSDRCVRPDYKKEKLTIDVIELDENGDPAAGGRLHTLASQPIINYDATDNNGPILKLYTTGSDGSRTLVHTDLTAIITGPYAGALPCSPYAEPQPTPNGHQPFREFGIHYHDDFLTTLAFPQQRTGALAGPLTAGRDFFAINYGIGGIGTEVLANRIGVGPMRTCVTCMFEEFFLSSWTVGDPAQIVDRPANTQVTASGQVDPSQPPASMVLYPDDPSNVYHSYLGDHVIFQINHAGSNITHVHHMHAQQWLHSPRNPNGAYRDSQMISPGASFTLNHVYNGSGNINKTVGDSIFHCHFYPHFAQGMWAMWRVHDMFEQGTTLKDGKPSGPWPRALPDGEIAAGTPTPAIVPLPTIGMPLMPARVHLIPVQVAGYNQPVGYMTEVNPADKGMNPGYPFFIPGVAGQRAPHPPLDFARDENTNAILDGGLPRHIGLYDPNVTSVTSRWNFTKTNHNLTAVQIPEDGTDTEKVAMTFHEHRDAGLPSYPSSTPTGQPSRFEVNGEPRKHGAPYANPNRDLYGHQQCKEEDPPAKVLDPESGDQPCLVRYKAVDIQIDAVFNKVGWHYPQTRLITLWGDAAATMNDQRMPEPFFFRANSEQIIEYWHTNLVPEYYELDDFQVRTPTDVIGQHIHLVKFDVTSSDGAGNGYNYEDGTFGAQTVRHFIEAINQCPPGPGGEVPLTCGACPVGLFNSLDVSGGVAKPSAGKTCLTPKTIPFFGNGPNNEFVGAQATIQRWSADPVLGETSAPTMGAVAGTAKMRISQPQCVSHEKPYGPDNNRKIDRTLRTVFTHDHFGPSTHQQAGLYAGLLIEPCKSVWYNGQTGEHYGTNKNRPAMDGGPTGWQANIVDRNKQENSYREFALEFADSQLAYTAQSRRTASVYKGGSDTSYTGWADPSHAVNPQTGSVGPNSPRPPFPALVTFQFNTGGWSLNYRDEPLTLRMFTGAPAVPATNANDLAYSFTSMNRSLAALNTQPAQGTPIAPGFNDFKYPAPFTGAGPTDPYTPLLRAYDGDNIQVRTLVGAHMGPHFFNFHGVNWLFEPQEEDSGYRSAQGMGISEHYEMIFSMPKTKQRTSDYLYEVTSDTTGRKYGNWGILRSYANDQPDLVRLPNNKTGSSAHAADCPNDAKRRAYKVKAMRIQDALGDPNGMLFYNARGLAGAQPPGSQKLVDPDAIIYVNEADLVGNKLPSAQRVEPLILRAAAGECVEVTLTNNLPDTSQQATLGISTTSNPQFSGTFTITAASADVMQEWWLALSGNFGQTNAFYIDTNQHGSPNYNFKTQFNTAPGNTFGYQLPNSNQVSSIKWNCQSTLPSSIYPTCVTTIVNGAQTFNVANDPTDNTKLVISTQQSPAMSTSRRAGLHASLLAYDVTNSDGMNVGTNPDQSVAPGGSKTYRWYAGRYERMNGVWTPMPVEYGAVNLNPADPLLQHPKGLLGALIIEPKGASWTVDQNSNASAIVKYTDGDKAKSFREFVAVIQDDVTGLQLTGQDQYGKLTLTPASGQWSRAFNYKTEPLQYRYVNNQNAQFLWNDPSLAPSGIMRAMSDQLTMSDPETPVFAAGASQPVRIRMLHPAGVNEQVLTLHGHSWQEEPYKPGTASRVIGDNPQSQHNGSRDSFGPNVSWDLVIPHAGGAAATKGDYPFRTFIGTDFLVGLWGILRVGDNGKDIVTVTYYPQPGSDPRFATGIKGTATANTGNGKLADKVEIYHGTAASGAPAATATIDPRTGQWSTTANVAPPIFVRSLSGATPWGSTALGSYIPTSGDTSSKYAASGAAPPAGVSTFGDVSIFRNEPQQPPPPPAAPKPQPQPQP
ncbi:MAG TPA: hypothetical protein VJZ76_08765 [Thermoanaerobaculia bacterium]|nr:hypothetical protein [Thermoanaerobaculia bacterium]